MIEAHVARSLGISEDQVKKTEPCACCGMYMAYAISDGKIAFHPWGGGFALSDCVVIETPFQAQSLLDHLSRGPKHQINDEIARLLQMFFS